MEIVVLVVVIVGIWVGLRVLATSRRRKWLLAKYADAMIVEAIMRRKIWQGQSSEQLVDSRGRPVDVDEKVMKTRKREVWKYQQTGRGRFALRITLDDDVVVGWDDKS
jgi:DUF971 family protein